MTDRTPDETAAFVQDMEARQILVATTIRNEGHRQVMLMAGNNKPVGIGITLHELIEYIQMTGQTAGRHLSIGEKMDLDD